MFGALLGVESFTSKKFLGVLATLCGVVMTSSIDISDDSDKNRGSFPHKTKREIAGGDALAFASAVMYGIYTTVLKKQVGNVERVNMSLFFGFVGLFTIFMLWPGIVILHITGIERFEIPPTQRIVAILLVKWTTIQNDITLTQSYAPNRSTRQSRSSLTCVGLTLCY